MYGEELSRRLVTDAFWQVVEPILPVCPSRPQGGGRPRTDERMVFTALTFLMTSGCSWRALSSVFGVTTSTAHRRFAEWSNFDVWERIEEQTMLRFGPGSESSWAQAISEGARRRLEGERRLVSGSSRTQSVPAPGRAKPVATSAAPVSRAAVARPLSNPIRP